MGHLDFEFGGEVDIKTVGKIYLIYYAMFGLISKSDGFFKHFLSPLIGEKALKWQQITSLL